MITYKTQIDKSSCPFIKLVIVVAIISPTEYKRYSAAYTNSNANARII